MSPSTDSRERREFAAEVKFLVSPEIADQIHDWARRRLDPDPHAYDGECDAYHITSLYFDTRNYDVFHRKGSFGRTKYRIRRYGPSPVAFLERKLKTRGLVAKRRVAVPLNELQRLTTYEPDRQWAGCWYHQRLIARNFKPVCQIAYRRTARVAMTDFGPIRLTLDRELQAVPVAGMAFSDSHETARLSPEQVILELKYRMQLPAAFIELIEQFALSPRKVSKYRLAAVGLGFVASDPELQPDEQAAEANQSTAVVEPDLTDGSICLIS